MNGDRPSRDSNWTPYVRTALMGAGAVALLSLLVLGVIITWLLAKDAEPSSTPPPTAGVVTTSEAPAEAQTPRHGHTDRSGPTIRPAARHARGGERGMPPPDPRRRGQAAT